MNILLAALSLLSALALTAAAVSVLALRRAHLLLREIDGRKPAPSPEADNKYQDLRDGLESLAARLHELRRSPPVTIEPGTARPGLNLNKRTQALRMHRRGDTSDEIASTLELPRQEVELLLKVHQIVLSNV